MATAVSVLASIITFVFAGAVIQQCIDRPRPYKAIWAVALLTYGVATLAQVAAELGGWSVFGFRIWYLSGGLLTAAYLGQGTAMLLLPKRLANTLLALLLVLTVVSVVRAFQAPISLREILPPPGKISPRATGLPVDLRLLAALLNIYGTLLLIGGALWSAVIYLDRRLDRRRRAGYRVLSTLLIAGGSLIVASAASLEALGRGEFLYLGEIVGITVIFLGFLRSKESMGLPVPAIHTRHAMTPATEAPHSAQPPTASDAQAGARHLRRVADRTPPARH